MKSKILLCLFWLLLFLLGNACAFFVEKIDAPLIDKRNYLKNLPQVETYCPFDTPYQTGLVGSNHHSQELFLKIIRDWPGLPDIFDHMALWGLMQLSVRPDQSAPTARLQLIFHQGQNSYYYDFFSEHNSTHSQYPYLYGLEWVLKKHGKKTPLETYAQFLQKRLGPGLKIGKELETFLFKNKELIKGNTELTPYYFRGNEILKENETAPFLDYNRVLKEYRLAQKDQKIIINTNLNNYVAPDGHTGVCNYDFNLYANSIFLIDQVVPAANLFGLNANEGAFLAASSQRMEKVESLKGLPLFAGSSQVRSSAVCLIEKDHEKIWAVSNQSRDPGQHLFHLMRYGLPRAESIEAVDKLLRHSRHLFLSDPVRLIIESQKSRPKQIENLLKLNLPIYHAQQLGNIWAYTQFGGKGHFVIDDRNPGTFICK